MWRSVRVRGIASQREGAALSQRFPSSPRLVRDAYKLTPTFLRIFIRAAGLLLHPSVVDVSLVLNSIQF